MEHNEATRRPGRPKREEETQTERRRRKGGTTEKLAIPDAVKQQYPDMEFRWGRDDGNRMHQLTQNDDWDAVPGVKPIHGGKGENGQGMNMHLLMKPKAFMREDQAAKMAALDTRDKEQLSRPDAAKAAEQGMEHYSVPGNRI